MISDGFFHRCLILFYRVFPKFAFYSVLKFLIFVRLYNFFDPFNIVSYLFAVFLIIPFPFFFGGGGIFEGIFHRVLKRRSLVKNVAYYARPQRNARLGGVSAMMARAGKEHAPSRRSQTSIDHPLGRALRRAECEPLFKKTLFTRSVPSRSPCRRISGRVRPSSMRRRTCREGPPRRCGPRRRRTR